MSQTIARMPPSAAWLRLTPAAWLRRRERCAARLDAEGVSQEMKRDIGLADGRASPPRDPLRD